LGILIAPSALKGGRYDPDARLRTLGCSISDCAWGLGGGHTNPELTAAVSEAGGFGALGCFQLTPDQIHSVAAAVRQRTEKPFALNFLLFACREDSYAAALQEKPAAIALAWPRPEQDLKVYIYRARGNRNFGFRYSDLGNCRHPRDRGPWQLSRKCRQCVMVENGLPGGNVIGLQSPRFLLFLCVRWGRASAVAI
jgi:hypothetical protein